MSGSAQRLPGPAQGGDGEDHRIQSLEIPELGEVETDRRRFGPRAGLDPANQPFDTPADGVRLVIVTSGTGASTGFGIAERVVADLFNLEVAA